MTDQQLETYVRSLINEYTAKFWTPEEIAVYKDVAIELVFGQFWHLLLERRKDCNEVSLQADTSDLAWPPDGASIDNYQVDKVEVASNGKELDYIESSQLHEWKNYPFEYPAVWMFKAGKIHVLPAPKSAQTNWLRIWFLKKAETLAELPAILHPLVAVEMVLAAKEKDEDVSNDLILKQRRFYDIGVHALSASQTQDFGSLEDQEPEESVF